MEGVRPIKTPKPASNPFSKGESGKPVNQMIHRGVIASLMYLTASKPDIIYSVYLYARFHSDPRESLLKVVKRILGYLVGTANQSLFYKKKIKISS